MTRVHASLWDATQMATESERVPPSIEDSQAPVPAGPVFLSDASDDPGAAERIAVALRGAGTAERDDSGAWHPLELNTAVVDSVEGIGALAPDYEHLYRVTGNTLPFALQEWHLAWCGHFLDRDPQVRRQPLFHVLRDGSGECVAIVPLILARRRVGPLKVASISLLGADPNFTEIRNPLVKPGYERLALQAVHASLGDIGEWDWVDWNGIGGPLAAALAAEFTPLWYEVREDFVLDLPPSWEELRAGLSRNMRKWLRHCYNSLSRAGHRFELVVARELAEVRPALDRFLELHTLRARMPWGQKHEDSFTARPARHFLYDVCERFAARGTLRVFQLKIGGAIVASRIGFVAGDGVYLYYSGFAPAWAHYSVMTTTMAEAFKYSIAEGLKSVNLTLIREQSKLRWRPRTVEFHSALVQRQLLRSRLVCRAYSAIRSAQGAPGQLLRNLLWRNRGWT
jgi:CelD/BcsL family acetyltransferase involved in cellulose biosynthesis